MRFGWNEASVLIATSCVLLSAIITVVSGLRRMACRRRLSHSLELERVLPTEGYDGLRALLAAEVRDCADRLESLETRRVRRRLARSHGTFALILMVSAAFLAALALPAAPTAGDRPLILSVAVVLALIALASAFRRDARTRAPSLKRAGDSTDPLPGRRPTLLAIWRWFPAGFSSSVDEEDTITARVVTPAPAPDLNWRQEAFPLR
jgi:hypothetical protein